MSEENTIIKDLTFEVLLNSNNELTVKLYPSSESFFELPRNKPFPYEKNSDNQIPKSPVYELEFS